MHSSSVWNWADIHQLKWSLQACLVSIDRSTGPKQLLGWIHRHRCGVEGWYHLLDLVTTSTIVTIYSSWPQYQLLGWVVWNHRFDFMVYWTYFMIWGRTKHWFTIGWEWDTFLDCAKVLFCRSGREESAGEWRKARKKLDCRRCRVTIGVSGLVFCRWGLWSCQLGFWIF